MNNLNNITQDWTHADQFLNDKIDKNNNSIKHDFDIVEKNVEVLNGVAEGQFVTDSTAMSVKVIPENAVKGIVSMIGGKTVKQDDVLLNAPVKKVVLSGKNLIEEGILKATSATSSNPAIKLIGNTSMQPLGVPTTTYSQYSNQFNLEPGTYTFTAYSPENKKCNCSIRGYKGSTYTNLFNAPDTNTPVTFTITGNEGYEHYVIAEGFAASTTYNYPVSLILERGSEYTGWVDSYKITLSLERIVDKLPDYGMEGNYIDFSEMVYHYRKSEVDLGNLSYGAPSTTYPNTFVTTSNAFKSAGYKQIALGAVGAVADMVCSKYSTNSFNNTVYGKVDKSICLGTGNNIAITDTGYTSVATFKDAMKGVTLVYPLAQEELIPLTDLLLPFKCEPGGTVTFENEHNLDVPNTVIYEKEMK